MRYMVHHLNMYLVIMRVMVAYV